MCLARDFCKPFLPKVSQLPFTGYFENFSCFFATIAQSISQHQKCLRLKVFVGGQAIRIFLLWKCITFRCRLLLTFQRCERRDYRRSGFITKLQWKSCYLGVYVHSRRGTE